MICTHCHGNIFIDTEDPRCPEYVCLLCSRRRAVHPPKVFIVPPELMKKGHRKREVDPEIMRRLKWGPA